ncbi:WD and tetratricopeptide repeats protein 1 [Eupeodes corollae]|uniref:WD and tetratricopeptide repeats protein 1 n=1 Tax=Eupeodes corollae TaxID=290404 RepID=UPI0024934716|nr:WD and tetratricopeptide repeats protein 1 [Eupeodes corollae]
MLSSKFYSKSNTTQWIIDRQYGRIDNFVRQSLQSASHLINNLELESSLEGHDGCVNCLEWSTDGKILASGSDDFQVILWDVFHKKKIKTIKTPHTGNMFSVKFLPKSGNSLIASGAADKCIYVFDINRSNEKIFNCNCHLARVKRLATAPDHPYMFWSVGEDGCLFQFDIRENHRCRSEDNVRLLNLSASIKVLTEAKCIAINPRRTEQIALGANDPYARIYDRRMLSRTSVSSPPTNNQGEEICVVPKDCVTYYSPGHIHQATQRYIDHDSRAITYLTFNDAGNELLVNMGGDHIYLYDLQAAQQPVFLNLPEFQPPLKDVSECTTTFCSLSDSNKKKLPEKIETFKRMGNEFLENEKYVRAIDQYSEAIADFPDCPVLYFNRAIAYMRRLWYGDVYAALRDCHQALKLDPSYIKAHFRLARALLDLGRVKEADECLKELVNRFPNYTNNHGVMMLRKDIMENKDNKNEESYEPVELPVAEWRFRSKAKDYHKRFVGHCNTTTDIKEANFFGRDGEFIVAGSDDGNFFIWDRKTCKIRSVYKADMAIVNCVQPHPEICLMATSGIDHDIKIWSPQIQVPDDKRNKIQYIDKIVESNQYRMKADPFDLNTPGTFCRSS